MIKVYSAPKEIAAPSFSTDWNAYNEQTENHVNAVKEYAKRHGKGKYAGEEVGFPVADGFARYIVFTPNSLIHLKVGDAWHYQHVTRLTQKDIAQKIESHKALAEIFRKK